MFFIYIYLMLNLYGEENICENRSFNNIILEF